MNRFLGFVAAGVFCSSLVAAEPTADDYFNYFKPSNGEWNVKAAIPGVFESMIEL